MVVLTDRHRWWGRRVRSLAGDGEEAAVAEPIVRHLAREVLQG